MAERELPPFSDPGKCMPCPRANFLNRIGFLIGAGYLDPVCPGPTSVTYVQFRQHPEAAHLLEKGTSHTDEICDKADFRAVVDSVGATILEYTVDSQSRQRTVLAGRAEDGLPVETMVRAFEAGTNQATDSIQAN